MWTQLSKKEQSFLLLFNNNVSTINLQPDILESYLNMIQKHIHKEDNFQESFIQNTLHSIENMGLGKFDRANPILFKLNPLFSIFLKREAKNLNKGIRVLIQSTYIKLYEGIAHTYHSNSASEDNKKSKDGFKWLMAEFDNILQALATSTKHAIKNEDSISQRYCQLALNQVHTLHQSQIDFIIQTIEEFSKISTNKNHLLALKQYFVQTRNNKN